MRLSVRRFQTWMPAYTTISLLVVCSFAGLPTLLGQEVGATLFGTVTDPAGATVPGASVTVTSPDTGKTASMKTQADGTYVFSALTPGAYSLTVENTGFKKSVQTGITLVVFQKARLDVQLEVGEVTTTVEVTGAAPLVESGTASVGGVVDTRQVTELPLNIRRFGSLPLLFPGAVPDRGGFSSNIFGSPFSETTYAANGSRGSGNNVLIDGVDSKNLFTGGFSVQPSPDSVQEFKVQTQSFSAVFGKNAGSTINLVTKSGTNELHGSAFEFLRNDVFDARNFFALEKPAFRRNQFGAAVGGPIVKNRTFWFASYEGLQARKGLTYAGLVPTPAMLTGDFSEFLPDIPIIDPLSCPNPPFGETCQAFTGNIIPADRIDSVAKKVAPFFPQPNSAGDANYVTNPKLRRSDHQVQVKVDHTFGPKDNIYVRYILGHSVTYTPEQAYTELPGFGDRIRFRGQNLALSWSHTFSPTMLNEFRFGFTRNMNIGTCENCPREPGFMEGFGIANLKALGPEDEGFPIFDFSQNYFTIGDSNYRPVESNDMFEKFNDTLTITKGKHTMAMGFDIQPYQSLRDQAPFSPHGQFEYANLYSNHPMSDFLMGYPSSAGRSLAKRVTYHDGRFWNAFFQDDIRVTQNLTLNLGLRWEYHQLPTDRRNTGAALVPLPGKPWQQPGNAVLMVPGYEQADELCNQPQFIADQGLPTERHLVACSDVMKQLGFTGRAERSLWFPDRFNWAPRFGFAWKPTGSDKLVVRGGYGLFFEFSQGNGFHYGFNNPVQAPSQFNFFESGVRPPFTTQTAFSSGGAVALKDSFLSLNVSPYFKQPYVNQWTFNIQSELSPNTALEVRYLGMSAVQMSYFHFFGNQAIPGPGDIQPRRLYPDLGFTAEVASGSNSNYNSLQVQLTRRMANGLSFLAGYTWGKSLTDHDAEEGGYVDGGLGQNDNNRTADYGRGVNDARQRLVLSSIYELPFGKGRRWMNRGGAANAILGGWELTSIITFQTGFPITPSAGFDVANVGTGAWRPDRICNGALPTNQRTVDHWFDTKCFTNETLIALLDAGTPRFGNSGRSVIDGPGFQNWDFGLIKDFPVREGIKVQFRAEFFNAFNQAHFDDPEKDVTSPDFGKIFGAGEPRDIQFGLKIIW
jgi:hypothetical protein